MINSGLCVDSVYCRYAWSVASRKKHHSIPHILSFLCFFILETRCLILIRSKIRTLSIMRISPSIFRPTVWATNHRRWIENHSRPHPHRPWWAAPHLRLPRRAIRRSNRRRIDVRWNHASGRRRYFPWISSLPSWWSISRNGNVFDSSIIWKRRFLLPRIYVKHQFPNLTLTTINFFITFCLLLVCVRSKLVTYIRLPILNMIPVSACFGGFIAFSNLSLQYNTVGTYQLIKMQVTPSEPKTSSTEEIRWIFL